LVPYKGDIVCINGKTGQYLEPAAGKVNYNIFAMLSQGLAGPINEGLTRELRQFETQELRNLKVGTNGGTKLVTIIVRPLSKPSALKGMLLVAFIDETAIHKITKTTTPAKLSSEEASQVEMLGQELEHSREQLQITREEMQTSQEELKSINEELQITNE
jgi:two-component system CheB/CheR fusion protein